MKYFKTMMMLLTLVAVYSGACGQHHVGIRANAGISRISNSIYTNPSVQKMQFLPLARGGLFYQKDLNAGSFVGGDLLYLKIKGKDHDLTEATDENGNPAGTIRHEMWKEISYLGLPLYYGLKTGDLTITFGVQLSFALNSSGRAKSTMLSETEYVIIENRYTSLNIDQLDFGPRAGVAYEILPRLSLEAELYAGMNNIVDNEGEGDLYWRIQQASFGLRYTLYTISE